MKQSFKIGSVVTGIALGLFLGYWLSEVLPKAGYIVPNSLLLYSSIGVVIFGLSGYFLQKQTEILAYATSAFIIFQYAWDLGVEILPGEVRNGLFIRALILLMINSFSGHYGLNKGINILLRSLGIK